jgi:DnaK suppressor protein
MGLFVDNRIRMTSKRTNKSGLTPAEIRRFKAVLLAKRTEILSNVICMEDETLRKTRTDLSNMPFHMADAGTDNYELENTLGLMDSERRILSEIEDALERIDDGRYGMCEGDNVPIPKARLNAIPWARYCVACANLSEKGWLAREEHVNELDYGEDLYGE